MGNFSMFDHIKYGSGCILAINTHIARLVTEAGPEVWGCRFESLVALVIFVIVIFACATGGQHRTVAGAKASKSHPHL